MAQKPLSKMEQINEGLRRLYALKEKEYDDVFKERCEENGVSYLVPFVTIHASQYQISLKRL